MDSLQIRSSINRIYENLNLIPSLRLHMFRVAAVGETITDSWSAGLQAPVNKRDIVAALLLHDLGNIVKFNFDEPKFWSGKSPEEVELWKGVKRDTINRYGSSSDHEVTMKMARELGISERLDFLLSNMSFGKIDAALASSDFDLKICMYSDQRVGPRGVTSIKERFEDLRIRYGRGDGWKDQKALELESQIFANSRIKPSDITEASVQRYILRYQQQRLRII